jgi:UDP-N-acetylglucosamine acyltransferase
MTIHPTAIVSPEAELHADVEIGPYAIIGPGVVLETGVRVGSHAVVSGPTLVGAHTRIFPHAVLGEDPQDLKYDGGESRLIIGQHNTFREFSTANRGTAAGGGITRIGDHNLFMAYSHVAHDCVVGSHCVFANSANLAGHVTVQDHVVLGGLVAVHQHSRIGRCAMAGGGAMVAQDVPPYTIAQGDRARLFGLNMVGLRRAGVPEAVITALKGAWRALFQQGLPSRVAVDQALEGWGHLAEVRELVQFLEGSTRGVCRPIGAEPAST